MMDQAGGLTGTIKLTGDRRQLDDLEISNPDNFEIKRAV